MNLKAQWRNELKGFIARNRAGLPMAPGLNGRPKLLELQGPGKEAVSKAVGYLDRKSAAANDWIDDDDW